MKINNSKWRISWNLIKCYHLQMNQIWFWTKSLIKLNITGNCNQLMIKNNLIKFWIKFLMKFKILMKNWLKVFWSLNYFSKIRKRCLGLWKIMWRILFKKRFSKFKILIKIWNLAQIMSQIQLRLRRNWLNWKANNFNHEQNIIMNFNF